MYRLVVGLPVKNEEVNVYKTLKSINEALIYTREKSYRIAVCVNNCTDNTEYEVRKFMNDNKKANCVLIKSRSGLVNAQRKIVNLFPAKIYVFSDADCIVEKRSIKLLLDELYKNKNTIVAYAKTVSFVKLGENTTTAEKIGILYDS